MSKKESTYTTNRKKRFVRVIKEKQVGDMERRYERKSTNE
jgi:hypothetical protein